MRDSSSYLKALKTFEVAARFHSFTHAAEELCVTQAAVSHQIKGLEEKLGFALFNRHIRRVTLTVAGENLHRSLVNAFAEIESTINDLRAHAAQKLSLNIALTPSFSSKWLLPRLAKFTAEYPNIELHLYHSISNRDLIRNDIDVAIRWGDGNWPGFEIEQITESRLIPVCAPDYIRSGQPLRSPLDLQHHALLHEDTHADWARWLTAAGVGRINSNHGLIIDDSNSLLLATLNGHGVALGRTPLIDVDVAAGRLVTPFQLSISCPLAYFLIHPEHKSDHPAIAPFSHFVMAEMSKPRGLATGA